MLYTTCQPRDFLLVFSCSGMSEMENEEDSETTHRIMTHTAGSYRKCTEMSMSV